MSQRIHEYFVYTYQYNTMPKPELGVTRNYVTKGSFRSIDTLPSTVIKLLLISAYNQKEAIQIFKKEFPNALHV